MAEQRCCNTKPCRPSSDRDSMSSSTEHKIESISNPGRKHLGRGVGDPCLLKGETLLLPRKRIQPASRIRPPPSERQELIGLSLFDSWLKLRHITGNFGIEPLVRWRRSCIALQHAAAMHVQRRLNITSFTSSSNPTAAALKMDV